MLGETLDRWKIELMEEGARKGRAEGEARLLLRQLQKRFGDLPRSVSLRVQQAGSAQIEIWAERLLDATSLDDLFESPTRP